jgi:basic membrane protein A and related proteins
VSESTFENVKPVGAGFSRRVVVKIAAASPLALALGGSAVRLAGAQDAIVVTMVTDTAGLGDQNFNDLAWAAVNQAATDFGIDPKVIESVETAQYVTNLTSAAEQSELTVGVGFLLTEAITVVAGQFPEDNFLLIDSVSEAPNVASVTFKEQEAAFLAGVVAGLSTTTGKIGLVGGQRIPPVIRYEVGFIAGIRSVNAAAADGISIAYADSFADPALGKEFALAQFNDGCDIVFPVAGLTGVGCYEAAKEKGPEFLVIGADTDQEHLAPGQQLCVARKGVDTAVYETIEAVVNGTFTPGVQLLGINEGGVGLGKPGAMVTAETLEIAARYEAAIVAGTVVPPSTDDELTAYVPTAPDALPPATPEASPAA